MKKILIMGGAGFVGRELGQRLAASGHRVRILTRRPEAVSGRMPFPCEIFAWPGGAVAVPTDAIEGCDAVVNLVGEGIADKAWTAARRAAILDSRVQSCMALTAGITAAKSRPRVVVQASGVGFYGDRGEAEITEKTGAGAGFLAETCVAWERGAGPVEALGARVVTLRIALVLGLTGGALPKLVSVYAKGLGAVLGTGRQWGSWIHVDDLTAMIEAAIVDERWRGSYNAAAPVPCRNAELNEAIGKHGHYSASKTVPVLALRAAMGGRAALVLDSAKVLPTAALALGFRFTFETIDAACAALLGDAVEPNLRRVVVRHWCPTSPNETKVAALPKPSHVALWNQAHHVEAMAGGTLVTRTVQYRLPAAPLGELALGMLVEKEVARALIPTPC